jgi:hypothetical protein
MQRKIDELRAFERDYRARLKAHLEDQLQELEQTGSDEPRVVDDGGTSESEPEEERQDG